MKFFAEALQKLGVLNITVALDTPSNADTAAFVTEGRSEAVLHHDGQTFIIPLPVPSIESQTTTFPPGGQTIELRAAMARDMTQHPRTPLLSAEDVQLRWDNERHISCRACRRLIVVPHSIRWKELPSQSWQEFSDLWHCHSGSSHSHTSCDHELKPTGDLPTLRAFPGTAFVGLMYLVFNFTDVQNVKQTGPNLVCECGSRLGCLMKEGWRFDFWKIFIGSRNGLSFTASQCWVSYMLTHVEDTSYHKYGLMLEGGVGIVVWVFSPGITITSSLKPTPRKVVKVFFKPAVELESDVERIEVDSDVTRDINGELAQVREQMVELPRLGEWLVGYLNY